LDLGASRATGGYGSDFRFLWSHYDTEGPFSADFSIITFELVDRSAPRNGFVPSHRLGQTAEIIAVREDAGQ
jgi:hypothetical protein